MESPQLEDVGSPRIIQGCLYGAVLLFVVLLAIMIVLAYLRFMEATGPNGIQSPPERPAVSLRAAPAAPGIRFA